MNNDNESISSVECEEDEETKKARKKSLVYDYIREGKAVFISLDLEHGGENCGITQLSAQIFRLCRDSVVKENKVKPPYDDIFIEEEFNEYVKPPQDAEWNEHTIAITGLGPTDQRIMEADSIEIVWGRFVAFINKYVPKTTRGIIVAWNGESCEMSWLYKLTQAQGSTLNFPARVNFAMDPYQIIKKRESCKMNKKHSKLSSYQLSSVYKHVTGEDLEGAHSSIVDVRAQTKIVCHEDFRKMFALKDSVKFISNIFSCKLKLSAEKSMEATRPVHGNWKADNDAEIWTIPQQYKYSGGSQGGGLCGPSAKVSQIASDRSTTVTDIWLSYADKKLWKYISECSQKYANEDWVQCVGNGADCRLVPCRHNDENARHRQVGTRSWDFTPGFIIAWHGILMFHGATAGDNMPISSNWESPPFGCYAPWIQNTMSKNAFEAVQRFIRFVKEEQSHKKGDDNYDPLYKVRQAMKMVMGNLTKNWGAGERITIDESMIKYMGRSICFIQYNPKKPIKHGIKVFVICCAITGHPLAWEVYCGKEVKTDNLLGGSSSSVCDRLIRASGLQGKTGRILFTDNWYTSMELAKHLWFTYQWLFIGTVTPTEKKGRVGYDIPFLKMSKGALDKVVRGWSRQATIDIKKGRFEAKVQCTTWKDRKQVMFLHTAAVKPTTEESTTERYVKGQHKKETIPCPPVVHEYAKDGYNGVDRDDRDGADYSVSIKTARWYLRIWFWILERVNHSTYVCVKHLAEDGVREDWKDYCSKHGGRRRMQQELGIGLMEYGIRLDWGDDLDPAKKPKWMRQTVLMPCNCNICFFCKQGLCNGIHHAPTEKQKAGRKPKAKVCSGKREKLDKAQSYCVPCYQQRREEFPNESSSDAKKSVPNPRYGCVTCQKHVCKNCWDNNLFTHDYCMEVET